MDENNYIVTKDKKSTAIFIFIVCAVVVCVFGFFLGFGRFYDLNQGGMINYAMTTTPLLIITGLMIISSSVGTWLVSKSKNSVSKLVCMILYYSILFLLLLWSLILFRLNAPIVACFMIGIAAAISIYLIYAYFVRNITAGILISIFSAWLLYVYAINLAYCVSVF